MFYSLPSYIYFIKYVKFICFAQLVSIPNILKTTNKIHTLCATVCVE